MPTQFRSLFLFSLLVLNINSFAQNCNDTVHTGEGTFYGGVAGSSGGNCSLPVDAGDFMHCALNTVDYDGSNACGACIEVTGPEGSVIVKVVDRCPECAEGDVDLTQQAFDAIADPIDGRISISWKFVECPFNNTIKLNFKEENVFFNAFQFRDIKHAVSKMEYREEETDPWTEVSRVDFNFFIQSSQITYPIDIRVTSILDEELIFENIIQRPPSEEFDTMQQFSTPAACMGTLSIEPPSTKQALTVYPNPTSGKVHINQDYEFWVIYSSYGELVKEGTSININASDLPDGIYFLLIDRQMVKLIKK